LSRLLSVLVLFATALAACSTAAPTGARFPNSDWFDTDVLLGVSESGRPLATVTVSAPYRRLVFYRAEDGFRAPYRLRAILRSGDQSLQMNEWSGEAWAEDYATTRGSLALQRTVTMELDEVAARTPAAFLEVQLVVDGTSRVGIARVPIEMGRFNRGGLVLGELAMYRLRDHAADVVTDLEVLDSALPDPERFARRNNASFDYATGNPWVFVRIFDLRKERADDQLTLRVLAFEGGSDEARWQRDLEFNRAGYETSVFLRLPEDAFVFGTNRIEVRLAEADAVTTQMENLGLDLTDTESWKANLRQVRVLATEEEWELMEQVPQDGRLRLWSEFWKRRDPDPETPENERVDIHYERVAYARAFLRDGFDDGALSDRGKVWIQYGRPDSIDNASPGFENYGSYEVWRYQEIGTAYYFRDVDGLGRFRLVWQEGI
jgi:GWxTD domain-containing protein